MKEKDLKTFRGNVVRVKTHLPNVRKTFFWNQKKGIYKETDSPYLAFRYEPSHEGKLKKSSKSFKNISEAKRWQRFVHIKEEFKTPKNQKITHEVSLENKGGEVLLVSKRKKEYTFLRLYEDFKKNKFPFIKTGGQRHYEFMVKHVPFLYPYEVKSITPFVIDDLIDDLKSPKKMKKYRTNRCDFEKELDALRAIFNWHIDYNRISNWNNPIRKSHYQMSKIRPKTQKGRNYMKKEEKERWYKALKEHKSLFFAPAFIQTEQIMRVGETFAMVWENVDFEDNTYLVTGHVIWDRVKKQDPYISKGTKTEGSYFLMPLRKPVLEILEELYQKRDKNCPYIFHNKGKLWHYKVIQNAYDYCFKKLDLPFTGTHVCRHTGATQFLEKTGDPLALQEAGNWKTQDQALHYGKILKQRLRRAIDKMDEEEE